ncbi:MAG: DNA mismatch repair endonuclease MutL [Vicinamibacteria bacterium]
MPTVKILPEALANQIAAGEVVERPASVVKELVENALDASATSVFVLLETSGKDRIRVTDDGIGMSAEDARLALSRHATSKLSKASDLSRISTLGFRGEALPSIASVSHLTLRTRDAESRAGLELVVEGGRLVREGEVGLPRGTIVDVRRLFFNVPARKKFLRADVTESSHIAAQMSHLAAAYPGVHFRLEHRGRAVLDAPVVSTRRERLFQLEGGWVEGAISLDESVGGLHVSAWLSPPAAARGATSRVHLFVNGRPVKDRILSHAVLEAYRQVSSRTGTPLFYLFLEIPPEKLDVNVHPAKMEVRFVDQRFVHDSVFSLVRNALHDQGRAPEIAAARDAFPYLENTWSGSTGQERTSALLDAFGAAEGASTYGGAALAKAVWGARQTGTPAFANFADSPPVPLGQFGESFIVATDDDGVWLVDQHAAHERILYERLLAPPGNVRAEQQLLLTPLPLELSVAERITLEDEMSRIQSYGFDIEPFGGASYVIRAVPAALSGLDAGKLVRAALAEREQDCQGTSIAEAEGRIAARIACHAAIKVNMPLSPEKIRFILDSLWKTRQPTVCPHGRPTTLRLGREQIAKGFGRI